MTVPTLPMFDDPPTRRTMPSQWQGSAAISRCGNYRWELRRWWRSGPPVAWLMLNPSTADALHDDPTIRRIIGWTWRWGYGGLVVVNLYPFRASKPAELWEWHRALPWGVGAFDPYVRDAAHDNLDVVERAGREAALRMAAFGAEAQRRDDMWVEQALEYFGQPSDAGAGETLHCLGTTKNGAPLHPMARGRLRVPDDQQPILWRS